MAHKFKCSGMQSILNGFLRYRANLRGQLKSKFEAVSDHPDPQNLLITCVDSRIVASRVVQTNPGETLLSRNPGNLIPHYDKLHPNTPRQEEAALELACVHNHVDSIILCGHADCKAMNLVYENRNKRGAGRNGEKETVLKSWLMANANPTIHKFAQFEKGYYKTKLNFAINDNKKFEAFIDPENEYPVNDKFSQVNTLTQLENLKHYKFVKDLMDKNQVSIYAMWLDIYCGDVFVFSYDKKRFVKLNEDSYKELASEEY